MDPFMERGTLRETGDANGKVPMIFPPNLLSPFPVVSPNLGYIYIYFMATYMYIINIEPGKPAAEVSQT